MAKRKRRRKTRKSKRGFIIAAVLVTIVLCWLTYQIWVNTRSDYVRYAEFGINIPRGYGIHGIDVSWYQESIAWEEVKSMQVDDIRLGFAFIKATEGANNVDRKFRRNWKKAKEAGVIRGAYHFFVATKDGRLQAENFIKQVTLEKGDLPPVLDIERTFGVSRQRLHAEVKEWLDIVEEYYGVRPIIYTNVDFYKNRLGSDFDTYPLWAAHYYHPRQPRIERPWSFWQHSEEGKVNGIRAKVDFNVFNGDSLAFRSLLLN